jgi:aspartate/methionine/tyrosine aminotransferase
MRTKARRAGADLRVHPARKTLKPENQEPKPAATRCPRAKHRPLNEFCAERMSRLGTETAFDVLAKAKALESQGKSIVHLEIGEPDFDTPKNIREAAKRALDQNWTHYVPAPGIPELRHVISTEVARTRKIPVDPRQVVVTPGGKPIMSFLIMTLCDPGDEIIYPNPGFPIYESMIRFMGGKAVPMPLREENDFRVDVDELKTLITKKTKLLIINSPHNPTGSVLTHEDLKGIADLAVKNDLVVLADEIYSRIIYDVPFESITQFPGMLERTVILDGFSKTYAMTGWRVGYGVMPVDLAQHIIRLMINVNSCTSAFSQRACIEALVGPQDDSHRMVAEFKRRRDIFVEGLCRIKGLSCYKPQGAFYVMPSIEGTGRSCQDIADRLLNEAGVAALSGTCFGEYGAGFVRFSYANSVENLQEALRRIERMLGKDKSCGT